MMEGVETLETMRSAAEAGKSKRGRPRKDPGAAPTPPAPKKAKLEGGVDLATLETQITAERTVVEQRLAYLQTYPLDSQERVDLFGKLLTAVRVEKDKLEVQRTDITKPLNAAKRAVDALYKPMMDLYSAMDKTIVDRLGPFLKAAQAAQDVALKAVGQGAADAATLAVAHGTVAVPEGLSEMDTYEVRLTGKLADVPVEFHMLDESLTIAYVKHKVKTTGKVPEIPGVEILTKAGFRRNGGAK